HSQSGQAPSVQPQAAEQALPQLLQVAAAERPQCLPKDRATALAAGRRPPARLAVPYVVEPYAHAHALACDASELVASPPLPYRPMDPHRAPAQFAEPLHPQACRRCPTPTV